MDRIKKIKKIKVWRLKQYNAGLSCALKDYYLVHPAEKASWDKLGSNAKNICNKKEDKDE